MTAVGGKLAVSSPNAEVAEVFDISGFVSIVEVYRSAETAAAHLRDG
jgi:anti-anti-sigma regulatory factor